MRKREKKGRKGGAEEMGIREEKDRTLRRKQKTDKKKKKKIK